MAGQFKVEGGGKLWAMDLLEIRKKRNSGQDGNRER